MPLDEGRAAKPIYLHYLRFEMVGVAEPFIIRVREEDWVRVRKILFEPRWRLPFISVESFDDQRGLFLNRDKLRICRFLWEANIGTRTEPACFSGLRIYTDAAPEFISIDFPEDPEELFSILNSWQAQPSDYGWITDEDGEGVAISSQHLIALEFCSDDDADDIQAPST